MKEVKEMHSDSEVYTILEKKNRQKEENLQIIKHLYAEFRKGNTQTIVDHCTEDVTWTLYDNLVVPFAGGHKGKDGVKRYFKLLLDNITVNRFEQTDFISDGNTVVVLSHQVATAKKTNRKVEQDICQVFKLRNGKIYSQQTYNDTRAAENAFK